ncbi:MAG TPA: tetratricopeptide repeat protein, partial [Tepidisphaeraceae bacterium]
REEEPPKPSTKLSTAAALPTLAANRSIEPKRLTRMLRAELDWIVLKALEKNRVRRYETASELSADVQHYLCGEPVTAHPPSAAYRLKKSVRRHKGQVIAASLVLFALLAGIAGTSFGLIKANRFAYAEGVAKRDANNRLAQVVIERDAKQAALNEAEAISTVLVEIFESPSPFSLGPSVRVVELLDSAARRVESELAGQPARRAALQLTLGRTYNAMGLPRQAIALHEQARDYFRATLGLEHHSTRAATLHLAASYGQAGRLPEAITLQSEVLAVNCKVCGPECQFTLWATGELAQSYLKTGRTDEGIKMLQDVLPLKRKVSGPEDLQTIVSTSDLAGGFILARRWQEAINLLEELLPLSRKVEGHASPDTLMTMSNLATSYRAVGRRDEAVKLLEEALPLSRKVNGWEHPDTLLMMRNLAICYSDSSRTAEAIRLLEEMLPLSSTGIGPSPHDRGSVMNHLAVCYAQVGRWEGALRLLEEALRLSRKDDGADDAQTRNVKNDLAWLLATCPDPAMRDPKRAVELVAQAVKSAPEEPNLLETLGTAQYRVGEYPAAVASLEKAIRLRKGDAMAADGFFLAMARWQLGDKQRAREAFDLAAGWMEKNHSKDAEVMRFKEEASALLKEK